MNSFSDNGSRPAPNNDKIWRTCLVKLIVLGHKAVSGSHQVLRLIWRRRMELLCGVLSYFWFGFVVRLLVPVYPDILQTFSNTSNSRSPRISDIGAFLSVTAILLHFFAPGMFITWHVSRFGYRFLETAVLVAVLPPLSFLLIGFIGPTAMISTTMIEGYNPPAPISITIRLLLMLCPLAQIWITAHWVFTGRARRGLIILWPSLYIIQIRLLKFSAPWWECMVQIAFVVVSLRRFRNSLPWRTILIQLGLLPPPTEFVRFSKLPSELRLLVWKFSEPEQRIITSRRRPGLSMLSIDPWDRRRLFGVPELLHTSFEARSEMQLEGWKLSLTTGTSLRPVWFNFDCDMYVQTLLGRPPLEFCLSERMALRHMGLSETVWMSIGPGSDFAFDFMALYRGLPRVTRWKFFIDAPVGYRGSFWILDDGRHLVTVAHNSIGSLGGNGSNLSVQSNCRLFVGSEWLETLRNHGIPLASQFNTSIDDAYDCITKLQKMSRTPQADQRLVRIDFESSEERPRTDVSSSEGLEINQARQRIDQEIWSTQYGIAHQCTEEHLRRGCAVGH